MVSANVAILDKCDSHPSPVRDPKAYSEALSNYTLFQCNGITLGYLLAPVVAALCATNREDWNVNARTVEINPSNDTFEKRSAVVAATLNSWRQERTFQVLEGWRNELYPIYGENGEILFAMERSATPLFGVVTFGVHMTIYVPPNQFQPMKIWTPKRSSKKPTYPSMLDNSVLQLMEHG